MPEVTKAEALAHHSGSKPHALNWKGNFKHIFSNWCQCPNPEETEETEFDHCGLNSCKN